MIRTVLRSCLRFEWKTYSMTQGRGRGHNLGEKVGRTFAEKRTTMKLGQGGLMSCIVSQRKEVKHSNF